MGTALNDGLRCLIGVCLRTAGVVAEVVHRLRASNYARSRAKLGRRLGIGPETRLATELPEAAPPQPRSPRAATKLAYTSGTGAVPKRLEYSSHRLAWVRWVFIESFVRVFWMLGVRRTSLYVFGPLEGEESLTGLLLSEERVPGYLTTLQAPYRIQAFPALRRLAETYGAAAVRLWILALSNPGVLYSTNPSTMSSFLDRLDTDWQRCSALVRDCVRNPERVGEIAPWVTRRLASRGHLERLECIADSPTSVPITEWAPAARVYICWTGGYVAPFLDRLAKHMPPGRFRLVPMYSMSTETIATIPDLRAAGLAFLPMARGVYYEFLEVESPREPGRLLAPDQLSLGASYELVVSHRYGLRRYCTEDVFRVGRFVGNLPDLRFVRRRGLAYSFTGEKLTGVQVSLAFERLRSSFPELSGEHALTCFPSRLPAADLPHYRLVVVHAGHDDPGPLPGLAERFDAVLSELNLEYRSKRERGRLGEVRLERLDLPGLRERLPDGVATGLDSQFKFLPLYPRPWESAERD